MGKMGKMEETDKMKKWKKESKLREFKIVLPRIDIGGQSTKRKRSNDELLPETEKCKMSANHLNVCLKCGHFEQTIGDNNALANHLCSNSIDVDKLRQCIQILTNVSNPITKTNNINRRKLVQKKNVK